MTVNLDILGRFFLLSTQWPFIIGLFCLGFMWGNKNLFFHAACIMLIGMVINVALKVTFQVPLLPSLGKAGFAFPSGHMQLATTLYGWLGLHSRRHSVHAGIFILLAGVSFALVHFDYHTWFDVFGALFFSSLILISYYLLKTKCLRYLPLILGVTSTLLMCYIAYRYTLPAHANIAYGSLISLLCIQHWRPNKIVSKP